MRPDIEAIQARVADASDAPWHTDGIDVIGPDDLVVVEEVFAPGDLPFIAEARQDIPALLAYVSEIEEIMRELAPGLLFLSECNGEIYCTDCSVNPRYEAHLLGCVVGRIQALVGNTGGNA